MTLNWISGRKRMDRLQEPSEAAVKGEAHTEMPQACILLNAQQGVPLVTKKEVGHTLLCDGITP